MGVINFLKQLFEHRIEVYANGNTYYTDDIEAADQVLVRETPLTKNDIQKARERLDN